MINKCAINGKLLFKNNFYLSTLHNLYFLTFTRAKELNQCFCFSQVSILLLKEQNAFSASEEQYVKMNYQFQIILCYITSFGDHQTQILDTSLTKQGGYGSHYKLIFEITQTRIEPMTSRPQGRTSSCSPNMNQGLQTALLVVNLVGHL